MRTLILVIAAIACFSSVTFAQSSQSSSSNKTSQEPKVDSQNNIIDPLITQEQLNKLPVMRVIRKPQITLQRALKIAERYAHKEKLHLSPYFLLEARMIQYGDENSAQELRWFFRWAKDNGNAAMGDYVEITVSMNGKATRLPSM